MSQGGMLVQDRRGKRRPGLEKRQIEPVGGGGRPIGERLSSRSRRRCGRVEHGEGTEGGV